MQVAGSKFSGEDHLFIGLTVDVANCFVAGNNRHSQLGLVGATKCNQMTRLPGLEDHRVRAVAAGMRHSGIRRSSVVRPTAVTKTHVVHSYLTR